ncbi:MAG: hypothetical protein Kow0042_24120 [Calditrichia bacterium]
MKLFSICNRCYFKVFILLILWTHCLWTQDNIRISGQVYDAETGAPLPGALIKITGTPWEAMSNEEGIFFLENIGTGIYRLEVNLLGYRTQIIPLLNVTVDQPVKIQINLEPQPLPGDTVLVIGRVADWEADTDGDKIILDSHDLSRYKHLGLPNLLQEVAGIQVETGGTANSRAEIRIHGSSASQVLVLLDGQRLNNPQTGKVDLSAIPFDRIERVEITRQPYSARYGGGAFSGVIAFFSSKKSRGKRFGLKSGVGSFSTYLGGVSVENELGKFQVIGDYQQDYSRQNFSYEYEGRTKIRKNAWYRNRQLFAVFSGDFIRHHLALRYNFRGGTHGLPSTPFDEQLPYDSRIPFNPQLEEFTHALQFSHQWRLNSGAYLENQVGYYYLNQLFSYNEEAVPRKQRYQTRQKNYLLEGKMEAHWKALRPWSGMVGISYLQEKLLHQDILYPHLSMGTRYRETYAFYGNVQYKIRGWAPVTKTVVLRGAVRYEKPFGENYQIFPLLGVSLVPSFLPRFSVSTTLSRGIRYPDFNSLFWVGNARSRGNPHLRPEKNQSRSLSLHFKSGNRYLPELTGYGFWEEIEDLIYWHRTFNGVWEPRNEQRAEKSGWDMQWQQNLWPEHLQIRMAYSWINARNKKADRLIYNKKLIFVAENTLQLSLWFGSHWWQGMVVYRHQSERETVISNSRGTQIPAYSVWDFTLSYQKNFGRFSADFGIAFKNLTHRQYQLIFGYPMPGREYQFSVSINFNPHNSK